MSKAYRFVKSVVRSMKRRYGQSITLINITSTGSIDWSTSSVSDRTTSTKTISKAIILPNSMKKDSIFDSGKYTSGGFFDRSTRDIVIDYNDLGTFTVDMNTKITFDDIDYKIEKIDEFEEGRALYITAVKVEGQHNE